MIKVTLPLTCVLVNIWYGSYHVINQAFSNVGKVTGKFHYAAVACKTAFGYFSLVLYIEETSLISSMPLTRVMFYTITLRSLSAVQIGTNLNRYGLLMKDDTHFSFVSRRNCHLRGLLQ